MKTETLITLSMVGLAGVMVYGAVRKLATSTATSSGPRFGGDPTRVFNPEQAALNRAQLQRELGNHEFWI